MSGLLLPACPVHCSRRPGGAFLASGSPKMLFRAKGSSGALLRTERPSTRQRCTLGEATIRESNHGSQVCLHTVLHLQKCVSVTCVRACLHTVLHLQKCVSVTSVRSVAQKGGWQRCSAGAANHTCPTCPPLPAPCLYHSATPSFYDLARTPAVLLHACSWPQASQGPGDSNADAILALEHINGYQGELPRTMVWPPNSEEVCGCV